MLSEIQFATGNEGKLREVQQILQIPVHQVRISLKEVQAVDVTEVIEHKAIEGYRQTGKPVLVEDTALHFAAWSGLPGALISWFMKTVGNDGLCQMMEGWTDRGARAVTVVGYYDGNEFHSFSGEVTGTIPDRPRGTMGFGWDAIFQPTGFGKTFAEMTSDEKNEISMRRMALEQFRSYLSRSG